MSSSRECPCGPSLKRFGGKAKEYSPRARIRHWMGSVFDHLICATYERKYRKQDSWSGFSTFNCNYIALLSKVIYNIASHSFTHSYTECQATASSLGAVRAGCLAQGHWDRTTNLPVARQTLLELLAKLLNITNNVYSFVCQIINNFSSQPGAVDLLPSLSDWLTLKCVINWSDVSLRPKSHHLS